MKVPLHLRSDSAFEQAYSDLVKALVPVRGQVGGGCVTKARSPQRSGKPLVGGGETPVKARYLHYLKFIMYVCMHMYSIQ